MSAHRFLHHVSCEVLALSFLFGSVQAAPLLESVSPLSCRTGSQVTVKLNGKGLDKVEALVFSIRGVTAKRNADGTFVVSVAEDTRPQECDLWCLAAGGLSNPRRFVISDQPTIAEVTGNDTSAMAQAVSFPGAVDGRLEAAARLDWFQFEAKAGQLLTISCRSRSLDGSAVPVLALFGPSGRETAHSSGRRREPLLHLALPATGTYRVRVSDRGYRSAADSFYRLELLAGPQIVAIWPDLVGIDPPEEFSLYGFGLEGNVASPLRLSGIRSAVTTIKGGINLERDSINRSWRDHFESFATAIPRTKKQTSVAGQPRIRFAERAMAYENETATESAQNAQQLVVPALLNGRFDRRNDVDWFAFDAKKDESFRIDVYGERFGQAMDLDVAIQDSAGKSLITFPDSTAPKNLPAELARASLDVSATWKAPADGRFHLIVRDLYGSTLFGADRTYALSLRKAEPSFDVSVMPPNAKTPAGYSIPRGGRAAVRVALVRHDGFNEGVRMVLTEASRKEGLALDETWIGPGETSALAIVSRTANEANARLTHFLELEAATDSDKPLVRKASATTLLRAGATDRRFMDRLPIGVSAPPAATFVLSAEKSDITAGGSLVLTVVPEFHGVSLKAAAKIEFPSLPTGMKASTISLMPGKGEAKVTIPVPAKLPLGRYSIAAQVAATVVQETDSAKENTIAAWSNGITFQVVPKQPPK